MTVVVTDDAALLSPVSKSAAAKYGARVLVLEEVTPTQLDILRTKFRRVVAEYPGLKLARDRQIPEIIGAPNAADLFIAGAVDSKLQALVLYRGNLERLVVPMSSFPATGTGVAPDFEHLAIGDFGHSIRLGPYEASADAILYEHDSEYRRKMKRQLVRQDSSFGGALRRLRLQKNLRRSDFPGISEKQIARIERGEIARPRQSTLRALAHRLGVAPEEIASF
jgi:hypothetical protein